MKKMLYTGLFDVGKRSKKLLLIMRFFLFLLLVFNISVSAKSFSQNARFNINLKGASLEHVINAMEEQSDIGFVYDYELVKNVQGIRINIKNATAIIVLDKVLKNTGLTYSFEKNIVVISKEKPKAVKQTDKKIITGKVVDKKGNPLPGVAVVIQGTTSGTATDNKGKYKIQASSKDALTFSFIGMKTKIVLVEDKKKIDVTLFSKTEELEEVSVVAFGEQKKESVVSAITTVKSEALKSSNSDLTSSFAGKIAGLIGWQTGGKPGALTEGEMNTKFYIRGITSYQTDANIDPLILLDGIEISKLDLARIDPDDIESFNVMKDASATAMYGARGANGVIYVKTKKGKAGNVRTSFRYEKIWSMPTKEIDVVNPKEYMTLFNQAVMERGIGSTPLYTKERIDNTGSDRYPSWVYPGTNWYDQLFKDHSVNNHYALNCRGGGEKIQYYVSATHNNDKGMLKSDRINQFDCNIKNEQTNFRINVNVNLNKSAKLTLNSFSTYDNYHGTVADVSQAYYLAFNVSPVEFAPTYPADDRYNWPHILFGGGSDKNPYAEIQQGYQDRVRYSTINNFEYIQNLSSFVKGLELRASIGVTKTGYFSNSYVYIPAYYSLRDYDFVTGEHKLTPLNEEFADASLRKAGSIKNSQTIMDYQVKLLHTAAWGNHQTSLTGVFTARQRDDSSPSSIIYSLPYRNLGLACRGTYGYKSKYFVEASFGFNGSERFAEGNRIGFFPSIGGAWLVSKEDFMRSTSSWLDFLKIRGSYGRIGNDGVIKNPRFLYLQEIERSPEFYYIGYPMNKKNWFNILNYGNEETEWETSEQMNLGFEAKLFKGLIDVNLDIYQEIRHNIYDYRKTLPLSLGLYMDPLDNVGKVKSQGIDFSGKIQHAFSSDFWFLLNTTFTYNKAVFKNIEEATGKREWQKKVGHDISQQYCYIAEGIFQDQTEIDNAPYQAGNVQPGDIRYRDIDGNGIIDVNDAVLAGYPETPRIIYGFNGFIHYKGFEFSMAFQGSGNRSFFINPKQISPFDGGRAVLREIANDHWTSENHKIKPFWPGLSISNIVEHNPQEDYYNKENSEVRKSTYFMRNGKFIRCTNIELGYYLNEKWLERYKIKNCRLYARANNPFIISDFDVWDVELGESGFNYPIQKTYSIGVNFSF